MYLYHGNDRYLSLSKAKAKYQELILVNPSYQAQIINAQGMELPDVLYKIESLSLFSSGKVIFIKRLSKVKGFNDEIEKFFNRVQAIKNKVEIILWEDEKIKSNSRYIKNIQNSSCFDVMNKRELGVWIKSLLNDKGLKLTEESTNLLLSRTNYNTEKIDNEISKLSLISKTGEEINPILIQKVVANTYENQIWDLTDAINNRDRKLALKIYENISTSGYDDYMILNSISRNLDQLIMIKELLDNRKSAQEIIEKTRIHPFVLSKIKANIDNYNWTMLKKIYSKINFIDWKSKQGKIDTKIALTMLLGIL